MSMIKKIKNFDLKNFFIKNKSAKKTTEIKVNNIVYLVKINKFISNTSLEVSFFLKNSNKEAVTIPKIGNLIFIFRSNSGSYHIPIAIKGKKESELSYSIELDGEVLHVEKRKYDRIKVNIKTKYLINSIRYNGIIENISPTGAKLIAENRIEDTELLLDVSSIPISISNISCKIIWSKKITNQKYSYGLNFQFDNPNNQHEIRNWIY
ncbi:PilZ domain-containing protein [Orenia marismortui]|uniref:PilZ domain-containing protein n=1 Tax=Orenia marismortui TaxID=46469 RepID=UPI000372801C|nr:PilZ domain-containing protein [Orenia marismortui]